MWPRTLELRNLQSDGKEAFGDEQRDELTVTFGTGEILGRRGYLYPVGFSDMLPS